MSRVLGLDVGEKTIGIAISDEDRTMAMPKETILRELGTKQTFATLRQLIAENQIRVIVVGLPLMADGTKSKQAGKVEDFVRILRNHIRIPIFFQNELCTTFEAEQLLMQANQKREDWKKTIDSIAASLILKSWLEENSRV